ncbi:MAG TPA: hypothetical protein VG125_15495 [Pirellulales bacterium]|nr:hypothetical protein [Pirellulales bacterium]
MPLKNEPRPAFRPAEYRRVIAARDAQVTEIGLAKYDALAKRLRREWAASKGEDKLHEMAFGEPF